MHQIVEASPKRPCVQLKKENNSEKKMRAYLDTRYKCEVLDYPLLNSLYVKNEPNDAVGAILPRVTRFYFSLASIDK